MPIPRQAVSGPPVTEWSLELHLSLLGSGVSLSEVIKGPERLGRKGGHSAQRLDEGEAGQPAGSEHRRPTPCVGAAPFAKKCAERRGES